MYSSMGMPKAQVFPVPVGAMAMMSTPLIISGMVLACTVDGSVKPIFSMALSTSVLMSI